MNSYPNCLKEKSRSESFIKFQLVCLINFEVINYLGKNLTFVTVSVCTLQCPNNLINLVKPNYFNVLNV